jgi:hypothetical protein
MPSGYYSEHQTPSLIIVPLRCVLELLTGRFDFFTGLLRRLVDRFAGFLSRPFFRLATGQRDKQGAGE